MVALKIGVHILPALPIQESHHNCFNLASRRFQIQRDPQISSGFDASHHALLHYKYDENAFRLALWGNDLWCLTSAHNRMH